MTHVLVVEDDPDIGAALEFNLRKEGYGTHCVTHGATALRFLSEGETDLVILDLMLPDIPGLDVCREIRSNASTRELPILMVTAKGEAPDRLLGLECGADDYLVKPFVMKELLLRAKAMLRRRSGGDEVPGPRLQGGRIVVDEVAHRVFVGEEELSLTHTEYKLLVAFLKRPGRVFSREYLLDRVWNMPWSVVTRTVDTHVKRLREKLGSEGAGIETVRGVGYRYTPKGTS